MNSLKAIEMLMTALLVVNESMATVTEIHALLKKARAEGRDITEEELASLAVITDTEHAKTMTMLEALRVS